MPRTRSHGPPTPSSGPTPSTPCRSGREITPSSRIRFAGEQKAAAAQKRARQSALAAERELQRERAQCNEQTAREARQRAELEKEIQQLQQECQLRVMGPSC